MNTTSKANYLPTGIASLDKLLGGGLHRGGLIVIAERPDMGTYGLVTTMIRNLLESKKRVSCWTTWYTEFDAQHRLLSQLSGVSLTNLIRYNLETNDFSHIITAKKKIASFQLKYSSAPYHRDSLERFITGVDLIVYDCASYFKRGDDYFRSVARLSRKHRIPVIYISHLGRKLETRKDKRPRLTDFKKSTLAAKYADTILLPYREEVYNPPTEEKGIMEVHLAKNRDGKTGMVKLHLDRDHSYVTDGK